jgi:hypothetical protein
MPDNNPHLKRELVDRASSDPEFRRKLLSDPKGAIGEVLGKSLPENIKITVLEEKPSSFYVVLPHASPGGDDDLTKFTPDGSNTGATAIHFTVCC